MVDYTGRLFREGKTAISVELTGILARLGTSVERMADSARQAQRWPAAGPLLRSQP